jgi:hypothetical protein
MQMAKDDKTKIVKKYVCSTCGGTGKKKHVCSKCNGTGKLTCSKCDGEGKRKCPHCNGTGHACPVCSNGKVEKTRWINCRHCNGEGYHYDDDGRKCNCSICDGRGQVKETYEEICPNCNGDYTNTDHVCDKCHGKKEISCDKQEDCWLCDGKGKWTEKCPSCGGKGRWSETFDKVSSCNLRLFKVFSILFGFTGLQYLYIKRVGLFIFQFLSFLILGSLLMFENPISAFVSRYGINLKDYIGLPILILGVLNVLMTLIGYFFVKRDGDSGKLKNDYKKGWFWLLFLLFGFTGAHLAYTKERVLLIVHFVLVTTPTIGIAFCGPGIIPALGFGLLASVKEAIVAIIINAIFNAKFLSKDK